MLKEVDEFTYLGSIFSNDRDAERNVRCRIGKASGKFQKLHPIWSTKSVNTTIKIHLYASIIIPTANYTSETWKTTLLSKVI